jgi:hypothetical protein
MIFPFWVIMQVHENFFISYFFRFTSINMLFFIFLFRLGVCDGLSIWIIYFLYKDFERYLYIKWRTNDISLMVDLS